MDRRDPPARGWDLLRRLSLDPADVRAIRAQIARHPQEFRMQGTLCRLALDARARGMHELAEAYAASVVRLDREFFGGYFTRRKGGHGGA